MVILTQTDTTVGFISQDEKKLSEIKERVSTKPFIKVYKDFKTLLSHNHRVPNKFKNIVRRSKKTTFIINNIAFRVVKTSHKSQIIRDMPWHYSSSANERDQNFNREFCEQKADIIVENIDSFKESNSSSLYIINQNKRKKIR